MFPPIGACVKVLPIDNMIRQSACMDSVGSAWATSCSEAIRDTSAVIKSHTSASGGWQEGWGGGGEREERMKDEALASQRGSGQGLNVQDH